MRLGAGLALLLALGACDSGEIGTVALEPGERTTYRQEVVQEQAGRPDTLVYGAEVVQQVVASGQTVQGVSGLTEVTVTSTDAFGDYLTRVWYRVSDERLEEVAYGPATGPLNPLRRPAADPTLPRLVAARLADATRGADGDSVIVRSPARIVLEYPLEEGRSWQHFALDPAEIDVRSTRTVLGARTVATPLGDRACRDVRTVLYFGGTETTDFDWVDCFDADGLVTRTIRVETLDWDGDPVVQVETLVRTSATR